jgi:type I restriction enzyme M protein
MDLDSDLEALEQQKQNELEVMEALHQDRLSDLQVSWTGAKSELTAELKSRQADFRTRVREAKTEYSGKQKDAKARFSAAKKSLSVELKLLDKEIPNAERELKLLTNRGKLELILADSDLIGALKERWIAAEVAKRLDYPIFMAVSERGGKDNSGDYVYLLTSDGHLVEDASGQPRIDQDLVNYDFNAADLADAVGISDDQLCVAEAFVRFAQQQRLEFWRIE